MTEDTRAFNNNHDEKTTTKIMTSKTVMLLSWWCSDVGLVIERSLVRLPAGALSSQL